MRLLLDTCVFLWLTTEPDRISRKAATALDDPANELFLSHASVWEIYLKSQTGKLKLPLTPSRWLTGQLAVRGVADWPVDLESLHALLELPAHHRDPFDRMLIAQAKAHAFTLISPDPWIRKYQPALLW
ncbi:MAG: type II toxin-antitoxin system VapC family toxin [Verrucomicrobiales bacterium]|nr:type II toxin-antitoxin system VapC family toxin [Verrucomicrobiales bacterium]